MGPLVQNISTFSNFERAAAAYKYFEKIHNYGHIIRYIFNVPTDNYTKNKYGITVNISKNSPAPGNTYTLPNLIMGGQKSYQQCRCHKEQSPMIISIWSEKKMKLEENVLIFWTKSATIVLNTKTNSTIYIVL